MLTLIALASGLLLVKKGMVLERIHGGEGQNIQMKLRNSPVQGKSILEAQHTTVHPSLSLWMEEIAVLLVGMWMEVSIVV